MPKILAVAVATDISPPASPCGMCRQFIREFAEPDVSLLLAVRQNKNSVFEAQLTRYPDTDLHVR